MINTGTLRNYKLREHHRQNTGNITSTPSARRFLFLSPSANPLLGPPAMLPSPARGRSLARHEPCHRRDSIAGSADHAWAEARVPHPQCGAQHPLARVSDAGRTVIGLRSEDGRIVDGGINWRDLCAERGRDKGVQGRVGRNVGKSGRGFPLAVAGTMLEQCTVGVGTAIGGVVVAVGMTDGYPPRVRDRVAYVVATSGVVVRARVHGLDDILCVRSVVWLDSSGARGVGRSEDGRRECEGMQIGPLSCSTNMLPRRTDIAEAVCSAQEIATHPRSRH